jgi:uncharacterized Zn finger protein (UPF0148 family)
MTDKTIADGIIWCPNCRTRFHYIVEVEENTQSQQNQGRVVKSHMLPEGTTNQNGGRSSVDTHSTKQELNKEISKDYEKD